MFGHDVGDDDERAGRDRRLDVICVRHRDDRIGRHDPERLDAAVGDGAEHIDRLEAGLGRRSSASARSAARGRDAPAFSMSMCAASMLARPPTSRPPMALGWPVTENGPMPGLPMRPVAEMAVDDGVDLVGAGRRLVDALAVDGDGLRRSRRRARRSSASVASVRPVCCDDTVKRRVASRCVQRLVKACRMRGDVGAVERSRSAPDAGEQAGEQSDVAIRRDRQMQVGDVGCHRAARIDRRTIFISGRLSLAAAMRW